MFYSSANLSVEQLEERINSYVTNQQFPHDRFVKVCVEESVAAIKEGNFGVGGCLVKDGEVIIRGHNQMFNPYFRSDLHAEMNVMTMFEDRYKNTPNMDEYSLFTSLEPCPMCTVRLITCGVGKVFYAGLDVESGMMAALDRLTPVWVELARRQEFAEANCSRELKDMCHQAWLISANINQEKIKEVER